ncbi:hypothetical protein PUN28_016811 [Cardiocondyla obscurior]|uniref:Uncharacterized protein n=1 Tax=Cardiocondyla obscurior TaxID=286306 RepID=A0AAW2EUR1_9HYME
MSQLPRTTATLRFLFFFSFFFFPFFITLRFPDTHEFCASCYCCSTSMYVNTGIIIIKLRDNRRVILSRREIEKEIERERRGWTEQLEIVAVAEWSICELERMNDRSSLADFPFLFYQSRKTSIKSPRVVARLSDSPARSMPALVLRNGSEIEIYDAGSAVSPINDGVVYLEGTVGLYPGHARVKRERYIDNLTKL